VEEYVVVGDKQSWIYMYILLSFLGFFCKGERWSLVLRMCLEPFCTRSPVCISLFYVGFIYEGVRAN
jgi:hypothetical protein